MRAALSKLAIVASLVLGLVQLSAIAHAHEAAMSLSKPAMSALSTMVLPYAPDRPIILEADGSADIQVQCSGVFLAAEAVNLCVPAISRSRRPCPGSSDMAALPISPDPPPPRS